MRHALLIAAGLYTFACLSATPWLPMFRGDAAPGVHGQNVPATPPDTTTTPKANVKRTVARTQEDLKDKHPDLKDPENLSSETTYDETTNTYKVGTKLGQSFLEAPFYMTAEEYQEWSLQKSLQSYYRQRNAEAFENEGKNKFDFTDFLNQIQQIKKMGNIKDLASMIPGVGKAIKDIDIDDNAFKGIEAIILSMTPKERTNPEILNTSRKMRIAKGSGTNIQDVNRLLKQFDQTRKMMKMMTGSKMSQMMGAMKGMRRM